MSKRDENIELSRHSECELDCQFCNTDNLLRAERVDCFGGAECVKCPFEIGAEMKEKQMIEKAVPTCAEMLVRIERDLFKEGIKTLENRDNIAEIFERGYQFFKQSMKE